MASIIQVGDKWRASVRLAGHKPQHKTFNLKREATAWATALEADLRRAVPVAASDYTVQDLIDAYKELRLVAGREITPQTNTHFMLKHLEDAFGKRVASTITVKDYTDWVSKGLREKRGQNAMGMELILLKTVFKRGCAVKSITLPPHLDNALTLTQQMGMIKTTANKRTRIIKGTELNQIMLHLPSDEMRSMVAFAAITALRRSELLSLLWSDFDEENKMLLVRNRKHPRQKQGNDDNIPLLFGAFEILKDLPRTSERIFPSYSKERVSDWFLAACRKAKVSNLRYHDLRHSAITQMFVYGLAIQQVSLISGHRDWAHLKRYTNLDPQDLHEDFPNGNMDCNQIQIV